MATTLREYSPAIVQTNSGRLVVAYQASGTLPDNTNTDKIYYRTSDNNGATWSETMPLISDYGADPSLAVTPQGSIWAVYYASGSHGVLLQHQR